MLWLTVVNVVAKPVLTQAVQRHPRMAASLWAWYAIVKAADWKSPQDIADVFPSADFVADNRVIFDIRGNEYRLVVRVSYTFKQVMVKFVGTHKEYDQINPATVEV